MKEKADVATSAFIVSGFNFPSDNNPSKTKKGFILLWINPFGFYTICLLPRTFLKLFPKSYFCKS